MTFITIKQLIEMCRRYNTFPVFDVEYPGDDIPILPQIKNADPKVAHASLCKTFDALAKMDIKVVWVEGHDGDHLMMDANYLIVPDDPEDYEDEIVHSSSGRTVQ